MLRSRTWDLDVEVVPYAESTVVLEKIAKVSSGQLAPFQRQAQRQAQRQQTQVEP